MVGGPPARRYAAAIAVTVFLVVGFFSATYHEMWRDEGQAWLLARDSGLGDLVRALRYEGHPALWFLILWIPAHLLDAPFTVLPWISAAIAGGSAYVFVAHAPFPRWVRTGAVLGYFSLYEYGVISRGYGLGIALLFAFCAAVCRTRPNLVAGGVALFLVAQTSALGAALVPSLVLYLIGTALLRRRRGIVEPLRPLLTAVGIAAAGMLTFYLQVRPPEDAGVRAQDRRNTGELPRYLAEAIVPIRAPGQYFWEHTWLTDDGVLVEVLALAFLVATSWYLRRHLAVLATFLTGMAALSILFTHVYHAGMRHTGYFYAFFLVCCWLREAEPLPALRGSLRATAAAALVAVQVIATAGALHEDRTRVFSSAETLARVIDGPPYAGYDLLVNGDAYVSAALAYADRTATFADSPSGRSFVIWNTERHGTSPAQVADQAVRMREASGRPVLVISPIFAPLDDPRLALYVTIEEKAVNWAEQYYLYTLR